VDKATERKERNRRIRESREAEKAAGGYVRPPTNDPGTMCASIRAARKAGEHGSADRLTEELYKAKDAAYLALHKEIAHATTRSSSPIPDHGHPALDPMPDLRVVGSLSGPAVVTRNPSPHLPKKQSSKRRNRQKQQNVEQSQGSMQWQHQTALSGADTGSLRLTNHLLADGYDDDGFMGPPACDATRPGPAAPLRYEDTPYPGLWMEPVQPNPTVQALLDPHSSLVVSHPALAPRDPRWARNKAGVGRADMLTQAEFTNQEAVPRGARRWSSRGVDAMFAPSLEQGYADRYQQAWAANKSKLMDNDPMSLEQRTHELYGHSTWSGNVLNKTEPCDSATRNQMTAQGQSVSTYSNSWGVSW